MAATAEKPGPGEGARGGSFEVLFFRPSVGTPPGMGGGARRPAARVAVPGGTPILGAARAAGLPLGAECGGRGRCRGCRVIPLASPRGAAPPPWLGPPAPAERRQLTGEELASGWRLACQTPVRGSLAVLARLADERPARKTIDTSIPLRLDPWAERLRVRVRVGEGPAALLKRALGALRRQRDLRGGLCLDPDLPPRLEPGLTGAPARRETLALTLVEGALVDLEPAETPRRACGAVVDIGTTNLCAYLIDLATGALLAEAGRANSQRAWGADLMARVLAATDRERGGGGAGEELARAVRRDVGALLADLLRRGRTRRRDLIALTFAGNSAMHHLFLGIPAESLGVAPYVPLVGGEVAFSPRELGLPLAPFARARFLPLLAGFVGADALGVALALGLGRPGREKPALALDLGTNVELLLGTPGGELWCASAPAGPAFEGGEIRCGMGAAEGAICGMDAEGGRIRLSTVGSFPAVGICGAGLIDVVAGLLDLGVIEPSGRLRAAGELPGGTPDEVRRRIHEGEGGRGFHLARGMLAGPVVVGQQDVRKLQSAKAAVRAGAELLLRAAGVAPEELGALYLAGAFGAHLRPERARRVGLLPAVPLERVRVVDNAAASGARLALLSRAELRRASALRKRGRYVELAGRPEFQEAFVKALPFPESVHRPGVSPGRGGGIRDRISPANVRPRARSGNRRGGPPTPTRTIPRSRARPEEVRDGRDQADVAHPLGDPLGAPRAPGGLGV